MNSSIPSIRTFRPPSIAAVCSAASRRAARASFICTYCALGFALGGEEARVHHPAIDATGNRKRRNAGGALKGDACAEDVLLVTQDDALFGARLTEGCALLERAPRDFYHNPRLWRFRLSLVKESTPYRWRIARENSPVEIMLQSHWHPGPVTVRYTNGLCRRGRESYPR